jgi:acyl-CoA thioester hydrolase
MSHRPAAETRATFATFSQITTRWMDNDVYAHVNNVVYYSFFDTAVNLYLIESGCLDIQASAQVGLVVETSCRYFSPIAFPDRVTAGIRVAHCGTSSVRYEVGLFRNDEDIAAAQGHFVHVYVDRATNRPAPLSDALRRALAPLIRPSPAT